MFTLSDWTQISTGSGVTISSVSDVDGIQTITMSDSTVYTTVIDQIRLFNFDSSGAYYSVNEDAGYEGTNIYNNNPTLYVQRGAKYKILNSASGTHPLFITKTQSNIDNPAGLGRRYITS